MAYWSKNNMFILNTLFYIQEDISPWNSRLRRSQVSYPLLLCSYLQTLVFNVFAVFGAFVHPRNAPFCFCVCFVLFVSGPAHILCLAVASGWNKERCIPEILWLLCQRVFSSVVQHAVKIPRNVDLTRLKFLATFFRPQAVIWLWRNWTFVAITEIFKVSI